MWIKTTTQLLKFNSQHITVTLIVLIVNLFFLFDAYSSPLSLDLEISGQVKLENYLPNGSKYKTFSGDFTLRINHDKWDITYSPSGARFVEHAMFDGVDVYSVWDNFLITDSNNINQHIAATKGGFSTNQAAYEKAPTVAIFSQDYPLGATYAPRVIWYSFLSGAALHQNTNITYSAPWASTFMPEASCYNVNVKWSESSLDFPEIIKYIASSNLWAQVARANVNNNHTEQMPFDDGFVAGTYRVVAWTNIFIESNHISMPISTEIDRNFPKKYNAEKALSEHYSLNVKSIKVSKAVIERYQIDKDVSASILDYRFMNTNLPWFYVVYSITNGVWKETNDPVVLNSIPYSKIMYYAARTKTDSSNSSLRYGIKCFLLVLLSAPAIVWITIRLKRLRTKTYKNK